MSLSIPTAVAVNSNDQATPSFLRRNILGTMASQVSVFMTGMVTSVLLNRSLGPEGKGVYAMVLTAAQLISLFASLGIAKSITFHLAQAEADRGRYFRVLLAMGLIAVGLSTICLFVLRGVWQTGPWSQVLRHHFWLLLGLTVASIASGYGLGVLRGLRKFKESNLYNALTNWLFLGLLPLMFLTTQFGVTWALIAKLSAAVLVIGLIAHRLRVHSFSFAPKLDPPLARELLTYGLGYFGYTIFQNLNYRFDVVLVSSLTTAAQTGCYTTATGLAEILWFLPNAIGTVLLPVIAGRPGNSADQLTARVCRTSLALMTVGAIGLCLIGEWAVRLLYGEAFLPTATVIYALAAGIVTNGLFTVLGTHLASRKKLGTLMAITGTGFAANVLLNLWFIPLWGIVGAGIASTISYSVTALFTARAFARLTGLRWHEFLFIRFAELHELRQLLQRRFGRKDGREG